MTATANRTLKWWTRGEGKRQWPTSALPQQEEWEIVSTAARWWPLAVTGLGLTLLMPVTAPIVGTIGALFTVATAWPLLQESRYALQERRFDVAMLSTGAVIGGLMTNHALVASLVASVHHAWQAVHDWQDLARMDADATTQEIYIVRCRHVGESAQEGPILRYVVETNGEDKHEVFTDMEDLRRRLLERLNDTSTSTKI
ncbi:MAG: hypothetical protein KDE46_19605 [Caldilineaceae bacterium]|nr:hypothetical protein [Caldilineaceae bacterium]